MIIEEELKFPSGTATAMMIKMLHERNDTDDDGDRDRKRRGSFSFLHRPSTVLLLAVALSSSLFLLTYFLPIVSNIPVLYYFLGPTLGIHLSRWGWTLRPALSYIGQVQQTHTTVCSRLASSLLCVCVCVCIAHGGVCFVLHL